MSVESRLLKVMGPGGERAPRQRESVPEWVRRLEEAGEDSLRGFRVEATDGDAGRIDQVLYWSDALKPDYVIIGSGRWLFGHKAVLPVDFIEEVDVMKRTLRISMSREQIRQAPEYLPF